AGSCSAMTLRQVAHMQARHPSIALAADDAADADALAERAFAAARAHIDAGRDVLVYSSAPPEAVAELQRRHGKERIAQRIEAGFAGLAKRLVAHGVRRLVVAGGETSGAVVSALGVRALAIGPQIDPGVPATLALGEPQLALVLKSGNFGSEDFFSKALEALR
ncbi:MAG TPA: nucleotide-binding domain containing protein, partial [Burkholderiales bacterium]|nr:nucleotide-binding domain containing protein [Burkholderiales bacterium]